MSGKLGRQNSLPLCLFAALFAAALASGCTRLAESEGIRPDVPERPVAEGPASSDADAGAPQADAAPDEAATGPTSLLGEEPRYEVIRGTGGVIGQPRRSQALATVEPGGDITLNFVDADVREVLKATLGGVLGVNYVVAPQVQGTITVQSGRPVQREALLPTLETVLRLHGLALVQEGAAYRVEPLPGAARGNAAIRLGMAGAGEGEGYGIQIVPLYYIAATQMAETLRPIAREGAILHVDEGRNLLVLGGTRFELAALLEAVEIFDVNWLAGMSFGLFKLDVAPAKSMASELAEILGDGRGNLLGGMVRIVPVDRLNAILAVSRQPRYLDELRRWVERLDQVGGGGVERGLHIYFVQNGKASDLAPILNDVFGAPDSRSGDAKQAESGRLAPGLEPVEIMSTAMRPTSAEQAQQGAAGGAEAATDQPAPTGAQESPAQAPPEQGTGAGGITLSDNSRVRIVASDESNALLISGTQAEYRSVLRVLRQLDRRPLEVLIEVTIADVQLTDQLQYGIRWYFQTDSGHHALRQLDGVLGATPSDSGLSYAFSVTNASAVIDLLSDITDIKVISAPQLMVLNNQEAQLQVGDQVPFQTTTSSDNAGNPTGSFTLLDTGVILKVTPRVNEGGLVLMDIDQEVSSATPNSTPGGPITQTVSKRNINTTVAVQSGQTVALGGLIQDTNTNSKRGVPGLSKIPFLGALFRSTTDTVVRRELLVLVTPRIVRDERGAFEATQELRRRIEELERLEYKLDPKVEG